MLSLKIIIFLVLLLFGIEGTADAAGLQMEIISPMQRVFPSTSVVAKKKPVIELWAARNEYESFQIAIQSDQEVTINEVETSDLTNISNGEVQSGKNFSYRFPGYVFLEKNTDKTPTTELDGKAPGMFPDPFEEGSTLKFTGTRSLWGTWYVPRGTKPGDYGGELVIHTSSGMMQIKVLLHVWGFTLPEKPSLYVTNWLHTSQIEKWYRVKRGSAEYWEIIDKIAQDMIAHRQNVIFTPLNLIRSTQAADGSFSFDFSDYEKWVNIFLHRGFQVFEGSHLFHSRNSYDIRLHAGLSAKSVEFGEKELATPKGQKFLQTFLEALQHENLRLGIQGKYLQHIADEASPEKVPLYREVATLVQLKMPGVAIIDATELPEETRIGMMDIPVTMMGKPVSKTARGTGAQWGKWWYTSVAHKGKLPNRFIDYPLIKIRMIPWLTWRAGMSGYLHYAYNWWYTPSGKSLWEDVTQSGSYPPGDGFVVYPPQVNRERSLISSLRWEAFRDGLEDYEYLNLLDQWNRKVEGKNNSVQFESPVCEKLGDQSAALLKEIRTEVVNTESYPRDPEVVHRIRRRIGGTLDRMAQCMSDN